ncbi:MAG TPA: histidine kinase [Bacteroidales bacterium]|nr:histidine kinase [Bacteroidales bacterium]
MTAGAKRNTIIEILLLAFFVLAFRLAFEGAIPFFQNHFNLNFNEILTGLLRNYPLALLMIMLDLLLVWMLVRHIDYGEKPMLRTMLEISGLLVIAFCSAILMKVMSPQLQGTIEDSFFNYSFWYTALAAMFFNMIIIAGMDIYAYYGRVQKKALDLEIGKKNKARFQYQQLKRQLNPHFLFNSLNSLDYLIHTDADKASDYVRKLASLYRHFLKVGEEETIILKDELDFVQLYIDLLSQRFDNSLLVTYDVQPEDMQKHIVPCSLQLLVENATKHNIVSKDKPLEIHIATRDGCLVVSNNIQPKTYRVASTGVGLKNIRGQYLSVFQKDITITNDRQSFQVKLPLLD